MEIFAVWLVFCVLVAVLAAARGRSVFGFFVLSFLLSPLIGLVVLLIVQNLAEEERQRDVRSQDQKLHASTIGAAAQLSRVSVADEIKKLADLRANGALNEDEFSLQKARLLAASQEIELSVGITCARCGTAAPGGASTCPGCGGRFVRAR